MCPTKVPVLQPASPGDGLAGGDFGKGKVTRVSSSAQGSVLTTGATYKFLCPLPPRNLTRAFQWRPHVLDAEFLLLKPPRAMTPGYRSLNYDTNLYSSASSREAEPITATCRFHLTLHFYIDSEGNGDWMIL